MQRDPDTGDMVIVQENAILRAQLTLESATRSYCIDTNNAADPIELLDDETVLQLQVGRIPDIELGRYRGWITLYDADAPNGIPWGPGGTRNDRPSLDVRVARWPTCEPEE